MSRLKEMRYRNEEDLRCCDWDSKQPIGMREEWEFFAHKDRKWLLQLIEEISSYTNTSCDAVARSFLVGHSEAEQMAGAKVADGILAAIDKIITQ